MEANLTIPERAHYVTRKPTLQFCDIKNRKPFKIRISEHLI